MGSPKYCSPWLRVECMRVEQVWDDFVMYKELIAIVTSKSSLYFDYSNIDGWLEREFRPSAV